MKTANKKIHEKKTEMVNEIADLIKNKKTMLIASVKNLPASQFQEISKKMRGKAIIKILKKNIINRALEEVKDEDLKGIKKHIEDSSAILFSDIDSFELASELIDNKAPAKAKIGQVSDKDIEVEAGPTDLVPGPAISELGALGIQIQIDKGKIHIKEPRIIVKKGDKVSENAASIMNKLDIKPFSVGFIPMAAFDSKDKKLYEEININREETLKELKESFAKALAFATGMEYFCSDTIKLIIREAGRHEMAMENLIKAYASENKTGEEVNKTNG